MRQINLAVHAYGDEHADSFRAMTNKEPIYVSYKESIQSYLLGGDGKPASTIFTCPADDFDCDDPAIDNLFSFWVPPPQRKVLLSASDDSLLELLF